MSIYIVYKHTSPSGKSYIGMTKNISKRNTVHRSNNTCRVFSAAIAKYGWDSFTHEILLTNLTFEEANEAERRLIAELNTLSPNGYNLTTGGCKNKEVSEETKIKLSIAAIGRPSPNRGKILSSEIKAKMSAAHKNKIMTKDHKSNREVARLAAITKIFIVIFPNETKEEIVNLKHWCEDRGLHYGSANNNCKRPKPIRCGPLKGYKFSCIS